MIMAEGMRLHAHSRGQASVALSSCEAEVMAASEGVKEALFLQEVLMFAGLGHYEIETKVDSSTAHAFFPRRGVGRMKHSDSGILWLQDLIAAGGVRLKKIPRTHNSADMLTHTPGAKELEVFLPLMSPQVLQCTKQGVDGHETVQTGSHCECESVFAWLRERVEINWVFQPCTSRLYLVWLFLRRTMRTEPWSRVVTLQVNTSGEQLVECISGETWIP